MRVAIRDRTLLARVYWQVERWEGSRQRAAKRLGVGAVTCYRLRSAQGGQALNARVFNGLYRYLPPDEVSERSAARPSMPTS